MRVKLVVNEPTLVQADAKQISATERSVVRSSAAARSSRRVSRYACGDSPNARRNSREKCARERPGGRGHVVDVERLGVAGVREVLGRSRCRAGGT